jgi:DNA-binding PadR family transcriptional regulator
MHRFHHHPHRSRHAFGWSERQGRRGVGRGGMRRGRVFEQGDLRLVLLKLIADKPSHGYELIKAVEEAVGGAYAPSPGVVYPTLTLLEDMGYVRQQPDADGAKKLYAITHEGQAHLGEQKEAVEAIFARMGDVATANRGRNAPEIQRAMQNLMTALMFRLGRGPMSEAQVKAVAAALDAAVRAIEDA